MLRRVLLTALQAAATLVAGGAEAQTVACDLLKRELAARIEATGVRDYDLEAVPAGAATPPDAKAIGNCSAGAYKVLYRRGGAVHKPLAAAAAASAVSSTPAPPPVGMLEQPTRGRRDRAAPAPNLVPQPVVRAVEAASAMPTPGDERPQAHALRGPLPQEVPGRPDRSMSPLEPAQPGATRAVEGASVPTPQVPARDAVVDKTSPARGAFEFTAERWLIALGLLVLVGAIAAWLVHRSAYDRAGLPRGPKARV